MHRGCHWSPEQSQGIWGRNDLEYQRGFSRILKQWGGTRLPFPAGDASRCKPHNLKNVTKKGGDDGRSTPVVSLCQLITQQRALRHGVQRSQATSAGLDSFLVRRFPLSCFNFLWNSWHCGSSNNQRVKQNFFVSSCSEFLRWNSSPTYVSVKSFMCTPLYFWLWPWSSSWLEFWMLRDFKCLFH